MSRAAPVLLNWRQTTQSMSDTPKKFYLTTPIYYVNARPHIGHAYTTVVADVIARRHRLLGDDTFFLTGTDEHGQKIERSAIAAGIPPQQFADEVSASFRALWTRMGILDDSLSKDDPLLHRDFIRTTEPRHKQGVQRLFQQLRDNGYIYLSTYTGQYCVSDEAYVDGPPGIRCPDCGRVTETVSESNYYFRLSAFQLPLLDLIESNTLRITPESRRNEVLSFLRGNPATSQSTPQNPGAPSMAQSHRDMGGNVSGPLAQDGLSEASVLLSEAEASPHSTGDPTPVQEAPSTNPFAPSAKGGLSDEPEPPANDFGRQGGEVRPLSQTSPDPATTTARTAAGTPFVPGALKDLSISRTSFKWGVPVPGDEAHVIYVWLDALANYMTAIGYGSDDPADIAKFERYWPADLHLVGKEIIRFHCVYWPAFLLALNPQLRHAADEPAPQLTLEAQQPWIEKMLPKAITAHGWLLFDDAKMSKSKGNIVRTETILDAFGTVCPAKKVAPEDPNNLSPERSFASRPTVIAEFLPAPPSERDLFATDVLRYFLLREIPFGQDGSFSFDALVTRYTADLTNGYGNVVSRTLKLIEQNFPHGFDHAPQEPWLCIDEPLRDSGVDEMTKVFPGTSSLIGEIESLPRFVEYSFQGTLSLQALLAEFAMRIGTVDSYLSFHKPWILAKIEGTQVRDKLGEILYTAAESIRIITALLYPILPFATAKVWAQLGLGDIEQAARNGDLKDLHWGGLQPGTKLGPLSPIFPRAEKGLAQTMADLEQNPPALTAGHAATPTGKPDLPEAPLASAASTPAPSRLTTETTSTTPDTQMDPTHPAAPPRTSAIEEAHPIAQVAGSASTHTQLHKPPSHTEAFASGPFNTAQSSRPIAPSSIQNPAAAASIPGQQTAAASATPTEGPGFSRALTSPAEGGTALPKAVLPSPAINAPGTAQITIDDFAKVELRVARILVCERIPKADKLLRLEVDLGPEPGMGRRQILSGIAQWYTPEELLGRKIIVIANLAPRKMRGLDSHGMLLAASTGEGGKPALATFADADNIEPGARLK